MNAGIGKFVVGAEESIPKALRAMNENAAGFIVVIDVSRKPVGVLTDGDVRRALIGKADMQAEVSSIMNSSFVCVEDVSGERTGEGIKFSDKVRFVPIVSSSGQLIDIATKKGGIRYPVLEPTLSGNELNYVTECVKSNWISSQGAYVRRFETDLEQAAGVKNCLAVSNGTCALQLALSALGIGSGDEVIVPNLTFAASVNAIVSVGAVPVLVDVDRKSWNICVQSMRKAVTDRTKAIMAVHLYGNPCDMPAIEKVVDEFDLLLVEDCAEALGASLVGKRVGSWGDAAAFSFFGNKVITCGEGGAVAFGSEAVFERAKILRDHGMDPKKRYWHLECGFNYRLTNLQAAVGCAQIEQLGLFREKRRRIFDAYTSRLDAFDYFEYQEFDEQADGSYWLFTILLKPELKISRDVLIQHLSVNAIDSRPVFYPMDEMPAFETVRYGGGGVSREISSRGFSLPSSVTLEENDIEHICNQLIEAIEKFERWG